MTLCVGVPDGFGVLIFSFFLGRNFCCAIFRQALFQIQRSKHFSELHRTFFWVLSLHVFRLGRFPSLLSRRGSLPVSDPRIYDGTSIYCVSENHFGYVTPHPATIKGFGRWMVLNFSASSKSVQPYDTFSPRYRFIPEEYIFGNWMVLVVVGIPWCEDGR